MLYPEDVNRRLLEQEFSDSRGCNGRKNLIRRIAGDRPFPIAYSLKPPAEKAGMNDIPAFQRFIRSWKEYPFQQFVSRTDIHYHHGLPGNDIPIRFTLNSLEDLMLALGKSPAAEISRFISRLKEISRVFCFDSYARFAETGCMLWDLPQQNFSDLITVLGQLEHGMGKGRLYLRALPLKGIDTKFVENHEKLIWKILTVAGKNSGCRDLLEWLGVVPLPDGFVSVELLDPDLLDYYHGIRSFRLPHDQLRLCELPGSRLLVVENLQSGYMMPPLRDTVMVFSTGRNLDWADGNWLKQKKEICYWGDLDFHGFLMLAEFRKRAGVKVNSLMMTTETVDAHRDQMVYVSEQPVSMEQEYLQFLTPKEIETLNYLMGGCQSDGTKSESVNRLEQEKLDSDFVIRELGRYFEVLL